VEETSEAGFHKGSAKKTDFIRPNNSRAASSGSALCQYNRHLSRFTAGLMAQYNPPERMICQAFEACFSLRETTYFIAVSD
jgi:hypothetical protein